ncbi:MAG: phospho-sugar mutase [Spirochaetes bacterium]|nr:MAG: phospho-sugar mutase [Spirochaetota bacterium]
MKEKELLEKAEEYVKLEQNEYFKREVEKLIKQKNMEELNDRFYSSLSFGTGGLRGIIGGGFNRINPFVVRQATQGLANYLKRQKEHSNPSVVIAYDSRHYSELFAEEAACVSCGNGIKTYLFTSLRPTPELSFAVRRLGGTAGIVITASHNPPEYNGYKVYWSDGGQIVPPHDGGIIEEVRNVGKNIKSLPKNKALEKNLLTPIDSEIDDAYVEIVKSHSLRPDLIREKGKELTVVYTPLHGTGKMLLERVLKEMGIDVVIVPEQAEPDGDFPTVEYPNPEEASAMEIAVNKAKEIKADLVMATDPDSDRLGIAVPEGNDYTLLSGNQLGALLCDYIFSSMKALGTLPPHPVFIKTIVTTELQRLIAESYGAEVYDVLTGFKYIGEKIRLLESTDRKFVFGGEESYGYLVGTEVRDKDAISAAAMTAEMALYDLARGKSVLDHLNELYRRFGYFEELLLSRTFKGQAGLENMKRLMENLRKNPPSVFAGVSVHMVKDYLEGITMDIKNRSREKNIELPSSNVIQFFLEDESIVTARPSGTEPKIKFYASCRRRDGDLEINKMNVKTRLKKVEEEINSIIKEFE